MNRSHCVRTWYFMAPVVGALWLSGMALGQEPSPKYPALPSETPAEFKPTSHGFDYERRNVMIPMRDGVKLHTVILVPKGALGAKTAPILLTRTPYDATELTTRRESSHLAPSLDGYDNAVETIIEGGYIRVVQDVRGKYGSEGDYVMNRPLSGPQNPTPVDHATDTWDTIDWLVKNVPESNGRVGILGISYDGFLPLMALMNPHPALKVSVPMNPMVDGWMGDDWFHYGAFRQQGLSYIYEQVVTRKNEAKWWTSHLDDYDMFALTTEKPLRFQCRRRVRPQHREIAGIGPRPRNDAGADARPHLVLVEVDDSVQRRRIHVAFARKQRLQCFHPERRIGRQHGVGLVGMIGMILCHAKE